MRKIASATLSRGHPRERRCTVELVELDLPASRDGGARYVVTVRQDSGESSLTATPCPLADAERRALDFIRRRLAAGETLVRREGFEALPCGHYMQEEMPDRIYEHYTKFFADG